jgi:hypothetical protein
LGWNTRFTEHGTRFFTDYALRITKGPPLFGKLAQLFTGSRAPGIYRYPIGIEAERILRMAGRQGWWAAAVDGRETRDKVAFLAEMSHAFYFPAYFGDNWDAFEEMVNDLAWLSAPGYLLVYDYPDEFARAHPEEWATALDILAEAVERWDQAGIPFVVLLRAAQCSASALPWL